MGYKPLELLEFKKMLDMLAAEASTSLGQHLALSLLPGTSEYARGAQVLGREIMGVLASMAAPSLYGATDIRPKAQLAAQGVSLTPEDLTQVLNMLLALESLSKWLKKVEQKNHALHVLKGRIPVLAELRSRLYATVDDDGQIRDSASPKLLIIRRSIKEHQSKLRRRAEELTRHKSVSQYLQEAIVTVRNGRLVLPVKQEFANKIRGLVHDQSSSGQTVYLEPVELLEMGNHLRRLELRERDEIDRILYEVSAMVGGFAETLIPGVGALADFDLGLAKARLASRWRGCFPTIVDKPMLKLSCAWHPLLKGTPVPMSIELSQDKIRTVVITGPNMGGKTVALKTCGLLTVMALSGMPCPCRDDTVIGNITDILLDIGDEQSIEESLSTFSAHISNVKHILENAKSGSLVLVDELGAGTDPKEGAALALAILRNLNSSRALSVITSHFSELKIEALSTSGMQNASVEWDPVELKPTYRLVTGRPGRSNAFLVAKRLGLDAGLLEEAKKNMDHEISRLEDVIAELEVSNQKARQEAAQATLERQAAEGLRLQYQGRLKTQEDEKKSILNAAKREAADIVSRARVDFEKAVKEFRDRERPQGHKLDAIADTMRLEFKKASSEFDTETTVHVGEPLTTEDAVLGTSVLVSGFRDTAVILEPPESDGTVLVKIGSLTLRAAIEDLRRAEDLEDESKNKKAQISGNIAMEKAQSVSPEIDLRGMTSDEAFMVLDKYFDDAILAGLSQVMVIHGKGTGALRRNISQYLETHRLVAEYRLGEIAQGGSGVTVVVFR